jgi:hypothetical protein
LMGQADFYKEMTAEDDDWSRYERKQISEKSLM